MSNELHSVFDHPIPGSLAEAMTSFPRDAPWCHAISIRQKGQNSVCVLHWPFSNRPRHWPDLSSYCMSQTRVPVHHTHTHTHTLTHLLADLVNILSPSSWTADIGHTSRYPMSAMVFLVQNSCSVFLFEACRRQGSATKAKCTHVKLMLQSFPYANSHGGWESLDD